MRHGIVVGCILAGALGCSGEVAGSFDGGPELGDAASGAGSRDAGVDAGGSDSGSTDAGAMFEGTAIALPADVRAQMTGVSWREGCPVGLDDLALLELTHWGFDGAVHRGQLVVAASAADDVLSAFRAMFEAEFPIEKIRLVDVYGADDDLSMADNNTSAFNCRRITGGTSYSQHSYGDAIDINPVQNPYVRDGTVLPPAGMGYLDRSDVRQGMIVDPGPVVSAFGAIGWEWGGEWTALKDYQHFSANGR